MNDRFWNGVIRLPDYNGQYICHIYESEGKEPFEQSYGCIMKVYGNTHEECLERTRIIVDMLNFHSQYIPKYKIL